MRQDRGGNGNSIAPRFAELKFLDCPTIFVTFKMRWKTEGLGKIPQLEGRVRLAGAASGIEGEGSGALACTGVIKAA
jgi:hypothetical protein